MASDKSREHRVLDVEFIQEKLNACYKYTELAKNRDVIAVIGNTGVGKSTLCNYLLGQEMMEGFRGRRRIIETVEKTDITIGHEVASETSFAMPILIEHESSANSNCVGLCLLDCPGFFDNRSIEETVSQSISVELAVRNAKQIKGVMILISLTDLMSARLRALRELVKTLVSLFKDPVEMVAFSIFVITHKNRNIPDAEAKEITLGALESLKNHCESQAKHNPDNPDDLSSVEYDRIAIYFSAILNDENKIVIFNPLDKGESRMLIFNQINRINPRRGIVRRGIRLVKTTIGMETDAPLRPITIDDFNFSEYDEHRIAFNNALYHLAEDGYILISRIREAAENIAKLHSDIFDAKEKLTLLNQQQVAIKKDLKATVKKAFHETSAQDANSHSETVSCWKDLIFQNEIWIASKISELTKIFQIRRNIDEELKNIDNDTPLLYMEKSIHRMVLWYSMFAWEEMVFSAKTEDESIPIIDVTKSKQNGEWIDTDDRRASGIYKITYQSQYRPRPAEASVSAFIRTKDEKGNRIRIKHIKEYIMPKLTNIQTDFKSQIKLLKSNNQIILKNIEEAETNVKGYKAIVEKELEKCKDDIEFYNSEIVRLTEEKEKAKALGLGNFTCFFNDKSKYDILVNINELLKFPSSLIEIFTFEYNLFLSNIGHYLSCFDEESTALGDFSVQEERVFGLKDPITGKEIKDLVITSMGTPFDEHSLLS